LVRRRPVRGGRPVHPRHGLPLHELQEDLASGRARTEDVRILEGRGLITSYEPDEGTVKSFCSRCGTNLFGGGWPDTEFTSVRLSALDEQYDGPLDGHTYVRSLAPWEVLPDDGAERYEVHAP
jgi:hypothetical protein